MSNYTLSQIRLDARAQARNALDSTTFFNRDVDKSLQRAGARWIRTTKEIRSLDAMQLVVGSNTLPAFPTGFLPEQTLDCYLTLSGALIPPSIIVTSIESVLQSQLSQWPWMFNTITPPYPQTSPPSGQPTMIGFSTTTAGITNYLPDQAYVLNLYWWKKMTTWTAGAMGAWSSATAYQPGDVVSSAGTLYQAIISNTNVAVGTTSTWLNQGAGTVDDPNTLTLNIPDESMDIITQFGSPYYLQATYPDKSPLAASLLQQFDAEARRYVARDVGGRGLRVIVKNSPCDSAGNWVRGQGAGWGYN